MSQRSMPAVMIAVPAWLLILVEYSTSFHVFIWSLSPTWLCSRSNSAWCGRVRSSISRLFNHKIFPQKLSAWIRYLLLLYMTNFVKCTFYIAACPQEKGGLRTNFCSISPSSIAPTTKSRNGRAFKHVLAKSSLLCFTNSDTWRPSVSRFAYAFLGYSGVLATVFTK